MADTVSVTQADRQLICYMMIPNSVPEQYRDAIMAGEWDSWKPIQTAAKHRLASTQPAPAFPREEVARCRAALQAILALDTQPVHVGYDHGAGGGNYVYEDFISADAAFGLARAALLQGKQP